MRHLVKAVLAVLFLTVMVSLSAQTAPVPVPAEPTMSIAIGPSYAQYGQPGATKSVFIGSTDYKLGGFLAFTYHVNASWAVATVASGSADRIMLKDAVLDPAKQALAAKGLSYAALTIEGRYYWRSMYFSAGPVLAKLKMEGGPDNKKVGLSVGIGGEFPLTKSVFIYTASSYVYIPKVEIVPGAPKNMSGLQSYLGLGLRF